MESVDLHELLYKEMVAVRYHYQIITKYDYSCSANPLYQYFNNQQIFQYYS